MCGLFGAVGPGIIDTDLKIVNTLGVLNILRGPHAAGVIFGKERGHESRCIVKKTSGNYADLWDGFRSHQATALQSDAAPNIWDTFILGHTRWATQGAEVYANAHPFLSKCNKIVGMHNGTIEADFIKDQVKQAINEYHKFGTDSEALINEIALRGVDATTEKLNDTMDSFALVWYDKDTKLVNFCRNGQRELFFAVNKYRHVMYYSSEEAHLKFAFNRFKEDVDIYEVNERVLFTMDPSDYTNEDKPWNFFDLPKEAKREPVKKDKSVVPVTPRIVKESNTVKNVLH